MVKMSRVLWRGGGGVAGIGKTLTEILVCPLSKQPLRFCEKSNALISDTVGVAFPIVDGIPRLVPKDGKIIDNDDIPGLENDVHSPVKLHRGDSS